MKAWPLFLSVFSMFLSLETVGQPFLMKNAHSHNDYYRENPLLDALSLGFKSVEADILLIRDDLYVGHNMPNVNKRITLPDLEESYLRPLDSLVTIGKGRLYGNSEDPLFLLIDIKTAAVATFDLLNDQLFDYKDILTHWENGQLHKGAVTVIVSDNRAFEKIVATELRLASIDGRPDDLGKGFSSEVMPLISERFSKVIKWNGKREIKGKELVKLKALTQKAHAEDKLVRLWATPEDEKVWEILLDAGVDLINTDEVARLQKFLKKRE